MAVYTALCRGSVQGGSERRFSISTFAGAPLMVLSQFFGPTIRNVSHVCQKSQYTSASAVSGTIFAALSFSQTSRNSGQVRGGALMPAFLKSTSL